MKILNVKILKADQNDLEEILKLQYLAYQSEAKLLNNYNIQPLTQTLAELKEEYRSGIILKAVDDGGRMIGSVRGFAGGDTLLIGKLMVHPDNQKKGVGTKLLAAIEAACPMARYELFTSSKSIRNIQFYENMGYSVFREKVVSSELTMKYMEKFT